MPRDSRPYFAVQDPLIVPPSPLDYPTVPRYLDPGKPYYWQIIAKDRFGEEKQGPICRFFPPGTDDDDRLTGTNKDDDLRGGFGNDTVQAGRGSDRISGGRCNDILAGGSGADRYIFGRGDGQDEFKAMTRTKRTRLF